MKVLLILIALLTSGHLISQTSFNDTLYYKSGMVRPCYVSKYDTKTVFFNYHNSKGEEKSFSIGLKQLKYFVIYDSTGNFVYSSKETLSSKNIGAEDSLYLSRNILSINPFSLALLGINVQHTYRFGENLNYGIRTTARMLSPILFGAGFAQIGVGFVAIPVNNSRFSLTLGITPSIYFWEGDPLFSIPVTMGFIRYLTPKIVATGNIGLGPGFGAEGLNGFPIPSLHFGIGFQLGKKEMTNY